MLTVRRMILADIPAVIPVHKEAFAGSVGLSVGDAYLYAIIKWFIEYPEGIAIVGEKDEQIVGYIYGAPQNYGQFMNRDLIGVILISVMSHPLSIFQYNILRQIPSRLRSILARRSQPKETPVQSNQRIYKLIAIGVKTSAHGQGVGRFMMAEFANMVWDKHFDEIQLSVYPNNTPARKLYEASGWSVLMTKPNLLIYNKQKSS